VVPGHYGERGHEIIQVHISLNFKKLLEETGEKRVVTKWDTMPCYIQNVLVPEIAIELIGEDMRLSREEAEQVMYESGVRAGRMTQPSSGRHDESMYTSLQPGLRVTSGCIPLIFPTA
jgi:hypothetical protein